MRLYNLIIECVEKTMARNKPIEVVYGLVESTNPLKIKVNQKLTLPDSFLVVNESLTDYSVNMQIDGVTKNVKVLNALKKGEQVMMLAFNKGQMYYVAERVSKK